MEQASNKWIINTILHLCYISWRLRFKSFFHWELR